jgi:hypothetical protein
MTATRSFVRTTGGLLAALAAVVMTLAQAQTSATATNSAPAKSSAHIKKATPAPAASALDLSAPPLSHIYPSKDLQFIMAYDPDSDDAPGEVSVKGSKQAVVVPGGPGNQFVAIPWALLHPTQAWRILTPIVQP